MDSELGYRKHVQPHQPMERDLPFPEIPIATARAVRTYRQGRSYRTLNTPLLPRLQLSKFPERQAQRSKVAAEQISDANVSSLARGIAWSSPLHIRSAPLERIPLFANPKDA